MDGWNICKVDFQVYRYFQDFQVFQVSLLQVLWGRRRAVIGPWGPSVEQVKSGVTTPPVCD